MMISILLVDNKDEEKKYNSKQIILQFKQLNDINNLNKVLLEFVYDFEEQSQKVANSGVSCDKILAVYVTAIQYQQQGVGSYIQLENTLADKQCCKNIQNKDESCSLYCFMYFYKTKVLNKTFKNYKRVNNYKFTYENGILNIKEINKDIIYKQIYIGDIQFACNLQDIKKIAKGFGFTFSLFEYQSVKENDSIKIVPRVIKNQRQITGIPHIDLLRVQKEQEDKINSHLVVIKNFQALMFGQCKHVKWYCCNCMCHIYKKDQKGKQVQVQQEFEQAIQKHEDCCYSKEQASNDEYPQKNTFVSFKSYQKQQQLPFFITADFESLIEKISEEEEEEIDDEFQDASYFSKTEKIGKHKAVSFGIQIYDQYNLLKQHYQEYVQKSEEYNVMNQFLTIIDKVTNQIMKLIKQTNIPYNETEEIIAMRDNATECYLCDRTFTEKDTRVIDHNYFTGEIRGIAHQSCNLHYHLQNTKISVIFNNLRGYDSHLIIKQIGEQMIKNNTQKGKIDCIANNSQKFLSFTWNNARFIDSIQFMNSSLATLGFNLKVNQKTCTIDYLKGKFGNKLSEEERQEVLNKGLFPYSWFDQLNKLKCKGLPDPEAFYNDLTDTPVNMQEYNQSKELFKKLGLKTFEEWLLLYQAIDIKLLTDIWISFRDMSLQHYKLEPGHYFTSPGLAWDTMLKLTKINLELVSNPDMNMIFERQSRGGISSTGNKRYSKANNIMCEDYNEEEEYVQNIYLQGSQVIRGHYYFVFQDLHQHENFQKQL